MARQASQTSELDRLFRAVRRDVPSPAMQRSLQSAVLSALRSGVVPPNDLAELSIHTQVSLGKLGVKLLASIGVVAIMAAGAGRLRNLRIDQLEPVAAVASVMPSSSVAPVVSSSVGALPEDQNATKAKVDSALLPAPPSVVAMAQPSAATNDDARAASVRMAPIKALPSEASLIDLAHRHLQSDPEHALALAETHRKLYPKGVLAQEREVIAIEALSTLGRLSAAEKRANSFRTKQPHSIHDSRLRAVLGDAGVAAHP